MNLLFRQLDNDPIDTSFSESLYPKEFLFDPRFVSPIPTALYHTAGNQVNISLISTQFSRRVILLKNGVITVKTG